MLKNLGQKGTFDSQKDTQPLNSLVRIQGIKDDIRFLGDGTAPAWPRHDFFASASASVMFLLGHFFGAFLLAESTPHVKKRGIGMMVCKYL